MRAGVEFDICQNYAQKCQLIWRESFQFFSKFLFSDNKIWILVWTDNFLEVDLE